MCKKIKEEQLVFHIKDKTLGREPTVSCCTFPVIEGQMRVNQLFNNAHVKRLVCHDIKITSRGIKKEV